LDISNPASPIEVGIYDLPGQVQGMIVVQELSSGNASQPYLYISTDYRGLHIFDLSEPAMLKERGVYDTPNFIQDVAISGQYAYIADGHDGLYVVNVSQPITPAVVGLYNQRGGACSVETTDRYVYVIFGDCVKQESWANHYGDFESDLYVLDISNPVKPIEITSYDLPEGESSSRRAELKIQENYAYIIDGTSSFQVLDISHPATPKKIDLANRQISDFIVINDYLYILPPGEVKWLQGPPEFKGGLDILDADLLTEISTSQLEYPALDVTVAGYYAYIYWYASFTSDYADGWLSVDISDPTKPVVVEDAYKPIDAQAAATDGHYAYIADGKAGLRILDISDPKNPIEVDAFGSENEAMDVAVADGYIYLANGSGGLHILRYPGAK
jgi:hypothetical protein